MVHLDARVFGKLCVSTEGEQDSVIQSIDRAIRVLTALQGARRMSLSELAARLDLRAVDRARHRPHPGRARAWSCRSTVPAATSSDPAVLRLGNVYLDTLELRSQGRSPGPRTSPAGPAAPCAPACCSSTTS